MRRFFSWELVERGGYGKTLTEAKVIGAAAEHGVPSPEDAEKN